MTKLAPYIIENRPKYLKDRTFNGVAMSVLVSLSGSYELVLLFYLRCGLQLSLALRYLSFRHLLIYRRLWAQHSRVSEAEVPPSRILDSESVLRRVGFPKMIAWYY
jgi:hypothetical protein